VDGYEAGAIEVAELKTRSDRVRDRMARARDELTALEKVLTERRELQLVVGRIEEFAKRVGDGLEAISWDERRAVVRALVARVEIDKDDVTIVYRIPAVAATATPGLPVAPSGGLGGCVLGARTPAYFTRTRNVGTRGLHHDRAAKARGVPSRNIEIHGT